MERLKVYSNMVLKNIPSSLCLLLSLDKGFPTTGYLKSGKFAPQTPTTLFSLRFETTRITAV